jgi:hypothetical protein
MTDTHTAPNGWILVPATQSGCELMWLMYGDDEKCPVQITPRSFTPPPFHSQAESQWQPIETAPIDGTRIDLWCDNARLVDCLFCVPTHNPAFGRKPASWCMEEWDGWRTLLKPIDMEPTYWMPTPPPPQSAPSK